MPMIAKEAGATVIDVNPERDALARPADVSSCRVPGGEVLPQLGAARSASTLSGDRRPR